MIRPATTADREAFHALARAYIAESGQRREYSEERTQMAFEQALADTSTLLLLCDADREGDGPACAGGILAQIDYAFTAQPVCIVGMFFVRPEYRGTGLARALMQAVCEWSDAAGCSHTFAQGNAMLGEPETQMFVNLTRKFGFVPCGSPVLARKRPCR